MFTELEKYKVDIYQMLRKSGNLLIHLITNSMVTFFIKKWCLNQNCKRLSLRLFASEVIHYLEMAQFVKTIAGAWWSNQWTVRIRTFWPMGCQQAMAGPQRVAERHPERCEPVFVCLITLLLLYLRRAWVQISETSLFWNLGTYGTAISTGLLWSFPLWVNILFIEY